MPDNRKDKTGGRKPGSGRPKGSKNINSMAAYKKLESLGFDPIEMMVEKYQHIQESLERLEDMGKHNSGAYAQMLATQGTLINNLMAYGYKKVPEKIEQEVTTKKPMAIRLTMKGDKTDGC
jgi:tyrosine-protein phosphatase YwqE